MKNEPFDYVFCIQQSHNTTINTHTHTHTHLMGTCYTRVAQFTQHAKQLVFVYNNVDCLALYILPRLLIKYISHST